MLHSRDLAMLDTLDWHPNVRSAMLSSAQLDPETAAAAQHAARAQAQAQAEDDRQRAAILSAQATVWYNRATRRPRAMDAAASSSGAGWDSQDAASPELRPKTASQGRRSAPPLARAAAASQPCLLGSSPIALPVLHLLDEPASPTKSRQRPQAMLRQARSIQQADSLIQQPEQQEQWRWQQQQLGPTDGSAAPPDKQVGRPVTAAVARRVHARTAMYLSR